PGGHARGTSVKSQALKPSVERSIKFLLQPASCFGEVEHTIRAKPLLASHDLDVAVLRLPLEIRQLLAEGVLCSLYGQKFVTADIRKAKLVSFQPRLIQEDENIS